LKAFCTKGFNGKIVQVPLQSVRTVLQGLTNPHLRGMQNG